MSEIGEAIDEAVERARETPLNRTVAVLVAVAATFLALCNVKDGNLVREMAKAQAEQVDSWTYYQAKSVKQNLAEFAADQLTVERATLAAPSTEARALLDQKLTDYRAQVSRYETEKAEIKEAAEGFRREYQQLNVHHDEFDIAAAALSVSIALLGITALTQRRWLLVVGVAFAGFGTALGLAGFAGWNVHLDVLARLLG